MSLEGGSQDAEEMLCRVSVLQARDVADAVGVGAGFSEEQSDQGLLGNPQ